MSAGRQASILLVDDRPHNLVALEAILEPLGHELVKAGSGERALRELLLRDFAVILLDVQMPGLDGFATADLIKGRERTKHVPIIFLTAISKENAHVDRGYSAGAVDYLFKPFDPTVLRSKVSVFIDLWEKKEQLREQEARLREQEIAALTRESEERYRTLTEALPQLVWRARADGYFEYLNERWIAYTGEPPEASFGHEWAQFLHPDDRARSVSVWENGLEAGTPIELEFRLRGGDGVHRWQLARAVPIRDAQGTIAGWVGACTDIDSQKKAEAAQRFLLEAGALLGSSLDYRKTLADVAQAAVPSFADWCAVHVLEQDGSLQQLAVAHADERKVQFARELQERYPTDPDSATGPPNVVRTGRSELVPEIPDELLESAARDELHLGLIREIGLRSYMCVPLVVRERTFGAITFVQAESGSSYDEDDLALAEELARRAATAVDNAQLYRQSEERGRAARVLATVGDGVFLLDADGVIRLWNPAAELLTGLAEADVLGRAALEVIPGWAEFEPRIPVASGPAAGRPETVPLELEGRELWLSISGVGFDGGTVYAFRDLTDERALEAMKSEFVATVSHELRTPLAAIHGSALTMLRPDLELEDDIRVRLLNVIGEESSRLAEIVNDVLLASHLDSGQLQVRIESCDARELTETVVEAARTYAPESVTLELRAKRGLPPVAADPGQLNQVLANLVDNAIKYSPEGGPVQVKLEADDSRMRFSVCDAGLGIPRSERERVFEKFYRLDPNMTRGIGGTGLGLYICRELVRTMNGRIWLEPREGKGTTVIVEIPLAEPSRRRATPKKQPASQA